MSQVTRCPACGTRFKVVADQLRISQGWVRCGMCQNVFDALQDLQIVSDEQLQSALDQQARQEPEAAKAEAEAEPVDTPVFEATFAEPARAETGFDAENLPPENPVPEPEPQPQVEAIEAEAAVEEAAEEAVAEEAQASIPPANEPAAIADEPGFVRQARRQAFWHSAGMRSTLALGSLLAVAALAAQYAWQQRDELAARHPALAPVLSKACELAGCELSARRGIADVVISGSGFKQLAGVRQYQWSLSLENRSDTPVAMPMAELTLTDAQDKPLLRRVIDLRPLGAPAQLNGREEWSVSVPVQLQELSAPVAGYHALVFYP